MIEMIRKIRISRLKIKALKGNKKAQYRLEQVYRPAPGPTLDDVKRSGARRVFKSSIPKWQQAGFAMASISFLFWLIIISVAILEG